MLEELGTYDPRVPETDARALLKAERIDYWLGVGAQPSEKVAVLIKKYGTNGTHVAAQKAALEKLAAAEGRARSGRAGQLAEAEEDRRKKRLPRCKAKRRRRTRKPSRRKCVPTAKLKEAEPAGALACECG